MDQQPIKSAGRTPRRGAVWARFDPFLVATIVVSSIICAALTSRAHEWSVMTDELLYVEMARSIWDSGLPLPQARGGLVAVYQILYPLLIAPIIGTMPMPDAYPVVAGLNAVIMVSAAIPAYMLTHYITRNLTAARMAALCTAVLPWVSLGTKIFTDVLALPMFVLAVYAIVVATAEPSRRHDWQALGALLLAYLSRSQFIVLLPAFCAVLGFRWAVLGAAGSRGHGVAIVGATVRGVISGIRAHWPVFAVTAIVLILIAIKPVWVLGIYAAAAQNKYGSLVPAGLPDAMVSHLGMIALGIGAFPLVLALPWIVDGLFRPSDERRNAGAIAIGVISLLLLFVATSFDLRFSLTNQVYERYLFYIAPLLICAAAALCIQPPRQILLFLVPVAAGLLIVGSDEHFGLDTPLVVGFSQSFKPLVIFQIELQNVVDASGFIPSVTGLLVMLSVAASVVAWWMITTGKGELALKVLLGFAAVYCLWATLYVTPRVTDVQNSAARGALGTRTTAEKTWVDRATGDQETSIVNYSFNYLDRKPVTRYDTERLKWWDVEFWNRSISIYYEPKVALPGGLPTMRPFYKLRVNFDTGAIELRRGKETPWLLMSASDPRFAPEPSRPPIFNSGFALYRVPPKPQAVWATQGLSLHGFAADPRSARLRVFAPEVKHHRVGVELLLEKHPLLRPGQAPSPLQRKAPPAGAVVTASRSLCFTSNAPMDISLDAARLGIGRLRPNERLRLLRVRVKPAAGDCPAGGHARR